MKFSLSRYTGNSMSAGGKAPGDINTFLTADGWRCAELYTVDGRLQRLANSVGTLMRLRREIHPDSDILLVQWPLEISRLLGAARVATLCRKKIVLIHDINSLRFFPEDTARQQAEIALLNAYDAAIVHNRRMEQWLKDNGLTISTVCLGVFDYIMADSTSTAPQHGGQGSYSVCFAGNLTKSLFLPAYAKDCRTPLYLYGIRPDYTLDGSLHYRGCFKPEELQDAIREDFGLIWDGSSCASCEGNVGNYMRYNNPHKLSLYLACGIPVIVWRQAAIADFVAENDVGLVIDDLQQIDALLGALTPARYQEMLQNVQAVQRRVRSGYYVRTAVEKALALL